VSETLNISELRAGMKSVYVKAKVLEISDAREVMSRYSYRMNRVATAVVQDESGKINLTLWNDQIGMFKMNDVIEVNNGYITEFRGTKQLNVGKYGTLQVVK
jgi:ssDNA-binding replication factor A large subunit